MRRQSIEQGTFILLLAAATFAFWLIIYDFWGAIFWAVILALIFAPLHRKFLKIFKNKRNLASLASLSVCIMLAIIPMIVIISAIVQEGLAIIDALKDPISGRIVIKPYIDQLWGALPETIQEYIKGLSGDEFYDKRAKIEELVSNTVTTLASFSLELVKNWGQNTVKLLIAFFVMLYLLFFLFRDGEDLSHQVVKCIPLSPNYKKHLFEKFATVVKATVKGNIIVAVVQGALGGLAFYFFNIQGALLWAVLMSFLSLLPAVGASLVWMPVAIYFFANDMIWQGVSLVLYGSLVIGMVDNLLRPILIGKDTKLPDYVVLITTLGGMSLVGLTGFVIGPLIAALFIAVWGLLEDQRTDELLLEEQKLPYRPRKKKHSRGHAASTMDGQEEESVVAKEPEVNKPQTPQEQAPSIAIANTSK